MGLGRTFGDNPLPTGEPDSRAPGDEMGDRLKEKAGTEPDDKGDNLPVGLEIGIGDDGLHPRDIIKRPDGGIDTIQYGGNKNGKPIDTTHGPAPVH